MSHFNKVANDWDRPQKVEMMQKLASATQDILKLDNKVDIMDFGAGTGLFGLEFIDFAKSLTGVDNSIGMLEVFNKKTENHSNIKSINIDLEKENLDQKFDLIISSMTFHHLEKPQELLNKLKKNLKPNGQIAIVDLDAEDGTFHPDNKKMGVNHFGFSKEELTNWSHKVELNLEHHIINTIDKNDREYNQFLAVFR